MLVTHIVLCRFAATTPDAEINAIFADLAELEDVVPGMLESNFGPNVSPEGLNRGFSHAFIITFADDAARDAYLAHPDHAKAGGRLVAACEGGVAGLTVIDI